MPPLVPDPIREALEAAEWYSLDLVIRGQRASTVATELSSGVASAILRAEQTVEGDTSSPPVRAQVVVGARGTMVVGMTNPSRRQKTAFEWVKCVLRELASISPALTVHPVLQPRRLDHLNDLLDAPPALTGFVAFTPWLSDSGTPVPHPDALTQTATQLAEWLRFPGADLSYNADGTSRRTTPARLGAAIVDGWPAEPNRAYSASFRDPRRARTLSVGYPSSGHLQALDPHCTPTQLLDVLCSGLRIWAQWTDFAFVRYAGAGLPHPSDVPMKLGRDATPLEKAVASDRCSHLLADYVHEASAAQILTRSHLDKANDLSDFLVEPLEGDRFLVRAIDPEPWVRDVNPDVEVLEAGRRAFGAMIMTEELIKRATCR